MLRLGLIVIAASVTLLAAPASSQQLQLRPPADGILQCGAFDPTERPTADAPFPGGGTLKCNFTPNKGPIQVYAVRPQFGRPAGVREPLRLEWNVHAGIPVAPAFLAGGYTGGVTIPTVFALGDDLLVGGNDNLVVLQPREASAPGQPTNVPNRAAEVTVLELQFLGCQPNPDVC